MESKELEETLKQMFSDLKWDDVDLEEWADFFAADFYEPTEPEKAKRFYGSTLFRDSCVVR